MLAPSQKKKTINKMEGLLVQSIYEGYWDFINYRIDDYFLTDKLDQLYPDNLYNGLIPTLVYWMEREEEKTVVWQRIFPDENQTAICPILMCPDDNDFSCTLIVAEIRNCGELIQWKRIGIDQTKEWDAEKVGSTVEWLDQFAELNFVKEEYLAMLENFKQRLPLDKSMIEEHIRQMNQK